MVHREHRKMHSQSRSMRGGAGARKSLGLEPHTGRPAAHHQCRAFAMARRIDGHGNFMENPYDKLTQIAPKTVYVQAKTYYGGGEWYTLNLDYKRIAKILSAAGYTGYCCLEFEGKQNPDIAVPRSLAVLRKTIGA